MRRKGRPRQRRRRPRRAAGTSVRVVDEINRADLSRVFGERMHATAYRERAGTKYKGGVTVTVHVVGVDLRRDDRDAAVLALWSQVRGAMEEAAPTAEPWQAPARARP